MRTKFRTAISIAVALLMVSSLAAGTGGVAAQQSTDFDVAVEFEDETPLATDNQTIQVTVENNRQDADLTAPVVEIPLGTGISVDDSFDGTNSDNPIPAATVTTVNGEEDRGAYTETSSFRSGEAVFIEGVEVPAGATYTYEVNVSIGSDGEQDIEAMAYPLNNEQNRELAETTSTVDPVGSLDISASDGQTVSFDGETYTGSVLREDIRATEYDITGDVSLVNGLTVPGVSVPPYGTASVDFSDPSDAAEPTVLAQTGPESDIVGLNTPLRVGNATSPFTSEFNFELISSGGETYIAVEDPDDLESPQGVNVSVDTNGASIEEREGEFDDGTLVKTEAPDDTGVQIEYVGYPLGDVTKTNDVTEDDAAQIATDLVNGTEDDVNMYGDVNQDGEITVVDAMLIEQYDGGNRDADYDLGGD